MNALYKKELLGFFRSPAGYVAAAVFLIVNSLILWVFPGDYNIPDSGFASMDSLFAIAPWMLLILVPAVTMKMFAEERKLGTLELLYTKPISDFKIVLAKYAASLTLVIAAILPTLIFVFSVSYLTDEGAFADDVHINAGLDFGQITGSYIGLFFLAAVYSACGLFVSSLTDNQITAYLLSAALCLFMFLGFDALSSFPIFGSMKLVVADLGISAHYQSVSRGVTDTRDVVWFVSAVAVFLLPARYVLQSRIWK